MREKTHNTFSMRERYNHSTPYTIKNYILSEKVQPSDSATEQDVFIFKDVIFGVCLKGYGIIQINFKKYIIEPNTIFTVFPNQIVKWVERSEDLLISTLFLSSDYITNISLPTIPELIFIMGKLPCLKVSEEQMKLILEYHASIVKQYNREHLYRHQLVKASLYILIVEVNSIYNAHKLLHETLSPSWTEVICQRFISLLMQHYREERDTNYYADKLCLSVDYLSTTIKKVTGESVLFWIHKMVILEAKILLKTTDMNIVQISDSLNLPNSSFFEKLFKKHTGMSPLSYRKNNAEYYL